MEIETVSAVLLNLALILCRARHDYVVVSQDRKKVAQITRGKLGKNSLLINSFSFV